MQQERGQSFGNMPAEKQDSSKCVIRGEWHVVASSCLLKWGYYNYIAFCYMLWLNLWRNRRFFSIYHLLRIFYEVRYSEHGSVVNN